MIGLANLPDGGRRLEFDGCYVYVWVRKGKVVQAWLEDRAGGPILKWTAYRQSLAQTGAQLIFGRKVEGVTPIA